MTFGQDHFNNLYFVSQKGLHRIVPPCLCSDAAEACANVSMALDQRDLDEATKVPSVEPATGSSVSLAMLSGAVVVCACVWMTKV
jgi:hypothetical protein